jgi:uncharacterized protein YjiS (DUF1127 family)
MHAMTLRTIGHLTSAPTAGRAHATWVAFRRWRRQRRAERSLSALDDATLKDIGIYRCQIAGLVRKVSSDPSLM